VVTEGYSAVIALVMASQNPELACRPSTAKPGTGYCWDPVQRRFAVRLPRYDKWSTRSIANVGTRLIVDSGGAVSWRVLWKADVECGE
jgi:hypothetical protein